MDIKLKLHSHGFTIKERDQEIELAPRTILWWRKGYPNEYHYKCEGLGNDGYPVEGVGSTLEEALVDFLIWHEIND